MKDFNLDIHDKEFVIFVHAIQDVENPPLCVSSQLEDKNGELWIDGELSNYLEPKERGMSMVFQNYALSEHDSLWKYGIRPEDP